jgi:excisionase family DNA binding protein
MAKANDELISVAQAGEVLGITHRHVHNLIADGLLPATRIGRAFAIRRADLAKVPRDRKPGPKPKGK